MINRKKRTIDFKYKIIFVMLGIVLSFVSLSLSFSYNFSFFNELFYLPFHYLNNEEDIIGTNINLELKKEIVSLKEDLSIPFVLSDFSLINGVVISRNPSYWLNEIVVNRGIRDGVEKGMGVVVGKGLVGYVKDVYNNYSIINLITNNLDSNTSVLINDTYLVLEYSLDGLMVVNQLDNSSSIKVGDPVLTSGLTDKYPGGITIGYVSKIINNSYDNGKVLYISLYYDINKIRYVAFLKRLV